MKRLQSIAFLFSLVFVSYSGAQAVPCLSLVPEWLEGRFVVVNQPTSKMLALQQITFGPVEGVQTLPVMGDAAPVVASHVFGIVEREFVAGAQASEMRELNKLDRVAFVTLSKVPDTCFLLWFSSDLQLAGLSQVLGQSLKGDLELGSDNRVEGGLQMQLIRR